MATNERIVCSFRQPTDKNLSTFRLNSPEKVKLKKKAHEGRSSLQQDLWPIQARSLRSLEMTLPLLENAKL